MPAVAPAMAETISQSRRLQCSGDFVIVQVSERVSFTNDHEISAVLPAPRRQIDASSWLTDPEVERVETRQSGASRQSEFVVYLKQIREGSEEEEE